jgi:hypothetical protein
MVAGFDAERAIEWLAAVSTRGGTFQSLSFRVKFTFALQPQQAALDKHPSDDS